MLIELRIRNFAIIESLTLPLAPGLNVLSGETGAGKSIIVGALGLLLGERASADLIRTGADKATVEGVFDVGGRRDLRALLDDRGIELDDALLVLKREVAAAGRARAWINGTTVTAAVLAEVGRHLVNLHGQHEAQLLIDPESQRAILDAFGDAGADAAAVREAHRALAEVRHAIADLERRRSDAERRADYLRHVVREIEESRVSDGEDARLEEEANRLENADELQGLAASALGVLAGEEQGVLAQLDALARVLQQLQRLDPSLGRLQESFDAAYYALDALQGELDRYRDTVELDPARLEEVRRRRDLLFRLVKKYGPTLADVIETGRQSRAELDLVDSSGLDLRALQEREAAARTALEESARGLSRKRADAARRLASAVDEVLPDLGMPDGRLTVALTPRAETGPEGAEDVEFRVALNIGHDARPLGRVASGGELSRVMLALKTILARLDHVPTLVFDEVDAGIGGRVGLQVGDTMRRVAADHQVFAITHLPQIAARAHHHILVSKDASGGVTTASVAVLSGDARVAEVARMLGGDPESSVSRAHAAELLDTATAAATGRATRTTAGAGRARGR
ncbi:MAG TPA: DNA repair protein RecN [Gemmatimonadaceae bacterium]|nr:DNA repair protein RecN [Gemmatimonadaceae bacterium]